LNSGGLPGRGKGHTILLYAIKKLGGGLSLRLSIDNVTRKGRGDDSLEYLGGTLSQREIDRAEGVRMANLSLEGKWC